MSLSQRKLIELSQKLDSLEREFDYWLKKSEENAQLQKHHTQIRRITLQLKGLQNAIRKEFDGLVNGQDDSVLSKARELELDILEVHRVWEFFRSKFVLRSVEWFNPYLVAADEFAWACYSSAQRSFKYDAISSADRKQPPLVFFNGGSSPYTLPRNLSYQAEQVVGEELRREESSSLLKELPIPVIGIPWFQVQHLPDALVIGHEVGHDVEEDFRLTDRITSLLDAGMKAAKIPTDRQPAWRAWLREIFADLFGILAAGPAFVDSLMDFLATDKTFTETDRRTSPIWGEYPPDYLRILINLEALNQCELEKEGESLKKTLEATYAGHAMQCFEEDIHPVVKTLLDGPYPEFGEASLKEVINFNASNHQNAITNSERLLDGKPPTTDSIRILFASARLAYSKDPEKYRSKDAHNLILNQVPTIQTKGVRAKRDREQLSESSRSDLAQYDLAAGEKLFKKLRKRA